MEGGQGRYRIVQSQSLNYLTDLLTVYLYLLRRPVLPTRIALLLGLDFATVRKTSRTGVVTNAKMAAAAWKALQAAAAPPLGSGRTIACLHRSFFAATATSAVEKGPFQTDSGEGAKQPFVEEQGLASKRAIRWNRRRARRSAGRPAGGALGGDPAQGKSRQACNWLPLQGQLRGCAEGEERYCRGCGREGPSAVHAGQVGMGCLLTFAPLFPCPSRLWLARRASVPLPPHDHSAPPLFARHWHCWHRRMMADPRDVEGEYAQKGRDTVACTAAGRGERRRCGRCWRWWRCFRSCCSRCCRLLLALLLRPPRQQPAPGLVLVLRGWWGAYSPPRAPALPGCSCSPPAHACRESEDDAVADAVFDQTRSDKGYDEAAKEGQPWDATFASKPQ